MTMLAEMHGSVAFKALSRYAKRALAHIERAIAAGGDPVVLTHDSLALDARRKTFSRSFRWRNLTSTADAVQLCAAARLQLPKRAPAAPRKPPAPASDAEGRRLLRVNQARSVEAAADRGARAITLPKLPPPWAMSDRP